MLDPKRGPGKPWFMWPFPRLIPLASNQNIPQRHSHEVVVNIGTQDAVGCLITSLAARNEKQPAAHKRHVNCWNCLDLSRSLEVKSNLTGRTYSSIHIKLYKIPCKIRNYIYFSACKYCFIQYVGENITPSNLTINIIYHYKNICKGASFSIQILEKVEVDGFIIGQ